MEKKVTVSLDLPADFQEACKTADINAGQTIQTFINGVSVYSFLVAPTMEPSSLASTIFKNYVRRRKIQPIGHPEKRALATRKIKLVIMLIEDKLPRRKKQEVYEILINEWYDELLKIEKK